MLSVISSGDHITHDAISSNSSIYSSLSLSLYIYIYIYIYVCIYMYVYIYISLHSSYHSLLYSSWKTPFYSFADHLFYNSSLHLHVYSIQLHFYSSPHNQRLYPFTYLFIYSSATQRGTNYVSMHGGYLWLLMATVSSVVIFSYRQLCRYGSTYMAIIYASTWLFSNLFGDRFRNWSPTPLRFVYSFLFIYICSSTRQLVYSSIHYVKYRLLLVMSVERWMCSLRDTFSS